MNKIDLNDLHNIDGGLRPYPATTWSEWCAENAYDCNHGGSYTG